VTGNSPLTQSPKEYSRGIPLILHRRERCVGERKAVVNVMDAREQRRGRFASFAKVTKVRVEKEATEERVAAVRQLHSQLAR